MSDLAVVVPIKALDRAKQRLASCLTPVERAGLVQAMSSDVLAVAQAATGSQDLWVCCGDRAGADLARRYGATVLLDEQPDLGLNTVIERVAQRLKRAGWSRILVIHADLPALSVEDIQVASHFDPDELLLVADHNGTGSNLLGWGLHTAFTTHYGDGSHERHRMLAARLGLVVRSPNLPWATFDVDRPADLQRLLDMTSADRAPATRAWLARVPLMPSGERSQGVSASESS